jgi:hypothetical protein
MEMESRVISGFEVRVDDLGLGAADVVGSWPSMDDFIIFHINGTVHMAARNPAGITPEGWAAIGDEFDAYMDILADFQ